MNEPYELFMEDPNSLSFEELGLLCSLVYDYRRKLNPARTELFLAEMSKIEALSKKLNGLLVEALSERGDGGSG
jgi:hypothetical protein